MIRRHVPSALSFGQQLLFREAEPPLSASNDARFHPFLRRAALFGFALGFAGAVLFYTYRHPGPVHHAAAPQPAAVVAR